MSVTLTFTIETKSDYHISAGHGLGAGIDSALHRDADGVPVVRGTTLAGLLRDGLWQLLQTAPMQNARLCRASGRAQEETKLEFCGQYGQNTETICPVCRLFGSPYVPKRWRVHSARPENQVQPANKPGQRRRKVVQRVGINPRTRRADPRKLFAQEDGEGGTKFTFTITCPVDDPTAKDEAALWVAAARNVRQFGRSRSRGQGECLFHLTSVEGLTEVEIGKDDATSWQETLLRHFGKTWLNGAPPSSQVEKRAFAIPNSRDGNGAVRVRVILRADEPLLIARRAEAGNQFESQPYITGQTLRGALAWRAARRYDLEDAEAKPAFVRTFMREHVLFPALYPAQHKDGLRPAIPAPRDLLTCKAAPGVKPGRMYDDPRGFGHGVRRATDDSHCKECPVCESTLREMKDFLVVHTSAWENNDMDLKVKRSNEMHIRIEPRSRRVNPGDLYGYVALDAGQFFVGDLYCQSQADWATLQAFADIKPDEPVSLHIGKASRRGYGRVTAWFHALDEDEADSWRRQSLVERVPEGTKEIHLTLLTDTIITDPWGRFLTGFEPGWLEQVLGTKVEIVGAAARLVPVDGFNGKLKLPRWRDFALAAGSTVRLEVLGDLDFSHLQKLEREGIGLRRGEGFGQIAFNHPVYDRCQGISGALDLPVQMQLASRYSDTMKGFVVDWEKTFAEQTWQPCRDSRFTAVARWLHTQRDHNPAKLAEKIAALGMPDKHLREEVIGKSEYGDRTKDNKLQEGCNKQGIDLIVKLLGMLNSYDPSFHPTGLEMLADRVAGAVDRQEN